MKIDKNVDAQLLLKNNPQQQNSNNAGTIISHNGKTDKFNDSDIINKNEQVVSNFLNLVNIKVSILNNILFDDIENVK